MTLRMLYCWQSPAVCSHELKGHRLHSIDCAGRVWRPLVLSLSRLSWIRLSRSQHQSGFFFTRANCRVFEAGGVGFGSPCLWRVRPRRISLSLAKNKLLLSSLFYFLLLLVGDGLNWFPALCAPTRCPRSASVLK